MCVPHDKAVTADPRGVRRTQQSPFGNVLAVAPHKYADRAGQIKAVGVACDGSGVATVAPAIARELTAGRARLIAMTVVRPIPGAVGHWDPPDAARTLEQSARDLLKPLKGVDARVAVGSPAGELVAFGDELDLLVVGSHAHGPLRRLILGAARCA